MARDKSGTRRWTDLSLRAKGLIVASLPLGALLLSTVLVARLNWDRDAAEARLVKVEEARSQIQTLFIVLISAESEVRNYGLSGHEEGLQPLSMVGPSADAAFKKLEDSTTDNPQLASQLKKLEVLTHQRLDGLKALRAYYDSPGARGKPAPADLINRARLSPDVLMAITKLFTDEGRRVQQGFKDDAGRRTRLQIAILVSVLAGLLGGVFTALLFTKGVARRARMLEDSAGNLERGVSTGLPFVGADELGRLAAAMERAGQTLSGQSEELKLALEGAEIVIWELDAKSGRIRYQAGSGAHPTASFPEELLPDSVAGWISAVHAEDRDRVREELNRIVAEGGWFQIEYRVVIRGGEIRWMTVRARAHEVGPASSRRLLGVLGDITSRKRASEEIDRQARELILSREALEQQTRILQSILDSMGDGVVVADTSGKFLVFNPAARQILGTPSFDGEPDQWAKHYGFFLPDMVSLYPAGQLPFRRAIRGESVDGAEIFARPAGAVEGTWVSVTARPLRQDDGGVHGGVMVIRNVTEAKRAAEALKLAKLEAEQANHAKSEFLSRMSHELRTPLNSILGFAQLLELGDMTTQQNDNVEHILKGGYHLLDLINEILDLARIESGRLSLSPEPVRMREALKDALDLVRPLAIQQNVNLSPDVAIRCDRHVHADRQRLKQVLLNLLSNAIKFNRAGGSVVISCEETQADRLRIEIMDTGSGISADGLQKIFKPFERLTADASGVSGTGLGLSLSKRLVEAMGGTIGVESAVGLGSRFFIELSIMEDPADLLKKGDAAAVLASLTPRSQRSTVLYIEDNSSNLRLVEQILSHRPNVRLISAMEGQLGIDLAELHSPEWILLDLHLPDIPGDEVLRRLRLNPRTRGIPVTILSADATPGQISRLMEAGARDYLTKPLDVRKLLSLLEQTMGQGEFSEVGVTNAYAETDRSK